MYLIMSMSDDYWQDHDRYTPYLTNFISPAVFVALGPRIAPERDAAYKRATALALFIICLFVVGAAIVGVVLFAAMGGHNSLLAGFRYRILNLAGAATGLLIGWLRVPQGPRPPVELPFAVK
jgi:hypothetical protein